MKTLMLSVVIAGMLSGIAYVHDPHFWAAANLIIFMFWPIIVMILVVIRDWNNLPPVDNIKMQNFYNLDALRRNSDQEARSTRPWENK